MKNFDFDKTVKILEQSMLKMQELDKKLYEKLVENDETILEDIKNDNLEFLDDIVKDMYKIQCITNAVSLRYVKQKPTIYPSSMLSNMNLK